MGAHGGRRGGAVAGVVTRTSRGTVPNRTVQYRTILCLTLQQEHTAKHILPCLSQRKPGGKKAAVENSVESVWKTCFKALRLLRAGAGAAGSLMGTFRRAWSGGGAAVDRSGARGRGCGGADAGSGGGRARRSMGQCRQGGCAGAAGAFGRAQSGARFRPVRVWWTLLAGALWRPCGAVRDAGAAQGALADFLAERKNT